MADQPQQPNPQTPENQGTRGPTREQVVDKLRELLRRPSILRRPKKQA